jgi:thymidylate kinase
MSSPESASSGAGVGERSSRPAVLDELFAALDASGVEWSLLRPVRSLDRIEGDIDVLAPPADRQRVTALVAAQGFVPLPFGRRDLHAAHYDRASDRLLWLDVQFELRVGDVVIPASEVLSGRVREGLPRPADPSLFWILLLRGLLEKGGVAERHRAAVTALAPAAGSAPEALLAIARRHRWDPAQLAALAAAGDWAALDALARPAARPRRSVSWDWARGLWTRRGVGVAILGPDGAGKTTLINGLRASLPFPTRVVYMGLTGGRMPKADRLLVPGVVLAARLALLWARYGSALYHRSRGRIVLFDRYPLDAAVPSGRELGPLGRMSRRVQGRACPKPDLVLLLDATGATMHRRKGEYDAAQLESWRQSYRRMAGSVRALAVIDAEQPADAVRREAQLLIWGLYARRWAHDSSKT